MNFKNYISNHNLHDWGIVLLYEDIIKPGIISLPSDNIQKLNSQYNSSKIFFHKSSKNNDYNAHYDPKTDEIHIYYNNVSLDELSAILSHELVHKEQHKRSGGHWQKQIGMEIDVINKYANLHNIAPSNMKSKIESKYNKLLDEFQYKSPQEQMAYALQFVKERKKYNYKTANDIAVKYKGIFGRKFQKYVGMYWLIKDKL